MFLRASAIRARNPLLPYRYYFSIPRLDAVAGPRAVAPSPTGCRARSSDTPNSLIVTLQQQVSSSQHAQQQHLPHAVRYEVSSPRSGLEGISLLCPLRIVSEPGATPKGCARGGAARGGQCNTVRVRTLRCAGLVEVVAALSLGPLLRRMRSARPMPSWMASEQARPAAHA